MYLLGVTVMNTNKDMNKLGLYFNKTMKEYIPPPNKNNNNMGMISSRTWNTN